MRVRVEPLEVCLYQITLLSTLVSNFTNFLLICFKSIVINIIVSQFSGPARVYDSDRSSRDEKVRSGTGISSTTVTTPESIGGKTPSMDSGGEESERRHRRPIGGVAVLPPMEMKRIEEQRKSPLDRDRKSPIDRPSSRSPGIPEMDSKYSDHEVSLHYFYSKDFLQESIACNLN